MAELELIGLDEDGEHIVLASFDGTRFRLRISEELRAAVRRDRPQLEQLRRSTSGSLSPREIQAQVRAGLTAQEIAENAGTTVEHVRRYEGPVLAEREYSADLARRTRVGRDADSPTLGDLVTDRLASRHVDTSELRWDAWRPLGSAAWEVAVDYEIGESSKRAVWSFDQQTRTLLAQDDESRWLSETRISDEVVPRRHLSSVRGDVFDVEAEEAPVPATSEDLTAALLDDLSARRGVRQAVDDVDFDDATHDASRSPAPAPVPAAHDDEPEAPVAQLFSLREHAARSAEEPAATSETAVIPAPPGDLAPGDLTPGGIAPDAGAPGSPATQAPTASPAAPAAAPPSTPTTSAPAEPGGGRRPTDEPTPPPLERGKGGRKGRPQVPSWDEIVFGARSDD